MCHCLEFRDEETEIYPSKDQDHTQLMKGQEGTAMAGSSLLFGGNVWTGLGFLSRLLYSSIWAKKEMNYGL